MNALTRLEKLPDWPARMTAPVAAAYMGVSPNTFIERYGELGRKEGANRFWARVQLDRLIEAQFGIENVSASAAPIDDPYERWKAGQSKG